MWHLAMIVVCSLNGDVCAYRTNVATLESEPACERLGYLVAGGALERAYGAFQLGEITVQCTRVEEVASVTSPAPGSRN
ncbi:MAG: hypothetical protein P1U88_04445 [Thalassobaculaceae bacterium]|nr:hypothetical protein [Thalassobaculaceae bacterium]